MFLLLFILKNVDDNWQTGKCAIEEFPLDIVPDIMLVFEYSSVNSTRIVRPNKSEHCHEIYNRWTFKLEKVLTTNSSLHFSHFVYSVYVDLFTIEFFFTFLITVENFLS